MKKITYLIFLSILSACSHVGFNVEQIKTNELLGAGYEHLDGKIFSIFCGGNGYTSYDTVKDSCLHNTALFVENKGYEYFTMLSQDGDMDKTYNSSIGTITKYSQSYNIILIDKDQLKKVPNYYKVSDYITSE